MNKDDKLKILKSEMKIKPAQLIISLENFIREYVEKLDREGAILGLSGGVDSAVVAALCKRAVGPEKTLALIMPERDSKKEHTEDALNFTKELGIKTKLINITPYLEILGAYKLLPINKPFFSRKLKEILVKKAYEFYQRKTRKTPFSASILGFRDKKFASYLKKANAYYRVKHRLRMLLHYLYGELENKLIVGAANKTEYKIGFFVKHGCDAAADIMPLLNLYKTQVRELAEYLRVPSKIIEKPPSPDIIPGITDEEAITIPYEKLDLILLALEKGWGTSEIADVLKVKAEQVEDVKNLMKHSEHMRKIYAPEVCHQNGI